MTFFPTINNYCYFKTSKINDVYTYFKIKPTVVLFPPRKPEFILCPREQPSIDEISLLIKQLSLDNPPGKIKYIPIDDVDTIYTLPTSIFDPIYIPQITDVEIIAIRTENPAKKGIYNFYNQKIYDGYRKIVYDGIGDLADQDISRSTNHVMQERYYADVGTAYSNGYYYNRLTQIKYHYYLQKVYVPIGVSILDLIDNYKIINPNYKFYTVQQIIDNTSFMAYYQLPLFANYKYVESGYYTINNAISTLSFVEKNHYEQYIDAIALYPPVDYMLIAKPIINWQKYSIISPKVDVTYNTNTGIIYNVDVDITLLHEPNFGENPIVYDNDFSFLPVKIGADFLINFDSTKNYFQKKNYSPNPTINNAIVDYLRPKINALFRANYWDSYGSIFEKMIHNYYPYKYFEDVSGSIMSYLNGKLINNQNINNANTTIDFYFDMPDAMGICYPISLNLSSKNPDQKTYLIK